MAVNLIRAKVIENSATILLARIIGPDGDTITQADVDSIELKVFQVVAGVGTLIDPPGVTALDPADVIFNTPQVNENLWPYDEDEGYNFLYELDGLYMPKGNATYQVEIEIQPVDGASYYLPPFQLDTIQIYGSVD